MCHYGVLAAVMVWAALTAGTHAGQPDGQITSQKRIFCNFRGCMSKKSQGASFDLLKLLKDGTARSSNQGAYKQVVEDTRDSKAGNLDQSELSVQSGREDIEDTSALGAVKLLVNSQKLLREAAMWEALLQRLRTESSMESKNKVKRSANFDTLKVKM